MNPRIRAVQSLPNFLLMLTFTDGSVRSFDMKPYLNIGVFRELADVALFNSVRPFLGSIQWRNGQDLCPDTLYENSIPIEPTES